MFWWWYFVLTYCVIFLPQGTEKVVFLLPKYGKLSSALPKLRINKATSCLSALEWTKPELRLIRPLQPNYQSDLKHEDLHSTLKPIHLSSLVSIFLPPTLHTSLLCLHGNYSTSVLPNFWKREVDLRQHCSEYPGLRKTLHLSLEAGRRVCVTTSSFFLEF